MPGPTARRGGRGARLGDRTRPPCRRRARRSAPRWLGPTGGPGGGGATPPAGPHAATPGACSPSPGRTSQTAPQPCPPPAEVADTHPACAAATTGGEHAPPPAQNDASPMRGVDAVRHPPPFRRQDMPRDLAPAAIGCCATSGRYGERLPVSHLTKHRVAHEEAGSPPQVDPRSASKVALVVGRGVAGIGWRSARGA